MTQPPSYEPPSYEPPSYEPPSYGPPPPYVPPPSPSAEPPYGSPALPPPPPYNPPAYGYPLGPPPRRNRALPVILAVIAAVLVLGIAVLVPVLLLQGDDGDTASARGPDLSAVVEYDDLPTTHLPPGETRDYPQSPAVGGNHAPVWLECGVYDEPVPEVNAVHDLEHGTVWLTYRDDLVDADGVKDLADQVPDNGIMSPYPDQEAAVVITVWGRQLELDGPKDERIELFIDKFGAGETAPEPMASCHGGVDPDDVDGNTGVAA